MISTGLLRCASDGGTADPKVSFMRSGGIRTASPATGAKAASGPSARGVGLPELIVILQKGRITTGRTLVAGRKIPWQVRLGARWSLSFRSPLC